jgi:arylsulfatase A-like enzyme
MKFLPIPVVVVLFILGCQRGESVGTVSDQSPNVIFILADDLGYGDLQCYGNPYIETPVLNELAETGVMFTNYYSPSPLCAPARAALLTGRYNHRTGAIDVSSNRGIDRIALSEKTFGDYFRHAGYATALIGKWHNGLYCNDHHPHKRGFDLFFGFPNGEHDYWDWSLMRNDNMEFSDGRYMTDVFNDEAIEFIRSNSNRPFALFLSHHAPHSPFQAPDHLIEKYVNRLRGVYDSSAAIIYAMIETMDSGLGRVFEELKQQELWENTIIVFTSDNGAHLGSSPRRGESCYRYHASFSGNKGEVLEQGIRVPAIVAWPGTIPGGRVVTSSVHGCDWLPTLYSIAGEGDPEGAKPLDGLNIMPLLMDREMDELASRSLPFQKSRYTPVAHSSGAIRKGEWKLRWPGEKTTMKKDIGRDNFSFRRGVENLPWEMPIDPDLPSYDDITTEKPLLFNLVTDPAERFDISMLHPELVKELTETYDKWFEDIFSDWEVSNREIIEHDKSYWSDREIPDPAVLFENYWQWSHAPSGTDPETADPLEVFTGYWNYKEKR